MHAGENHKEYKENNIFKSNNIQNSKFWLLIPLTLEKSKSQMFFNKHAKNRKHAFWYLGPLVSMMMPS